MSVLTVVQNVCAAIGLNRPNAAESSSDPQIKQLFALATKEGKDLALRCFWRQLINEFTFTTVAQESQGAIATLAPGYKRIVSETLHDRTDQQPVLGPLNSVQWQALKARQVVGPYSQYTIRGAELLFLPIPGAGHTIAGEYLSANWVRDAGSTTTRNYYLHDDDVALLDEDIIELGVTWRWLAAKGFSYSEEFASYERRVADAIAQDGTKPVLSSNQTMSIGPGVIVSEGSWSL